MKEIERMVAVKLTMLILEIMSYSSSSRSRRLYSIYSKCSVIR